MQAQEGKRLFEKKLEPIQRDEKEINLEPHPMVRHEMSQGANVISNEPKHKTGQTSQDQIGVSDVHRAT